MFRKTMIALAAVTFVGALAVSSTVDARGGFGGGGHFGGGGMRMGGGGFGGAECAWAEEASAGAECVLSAGVSAVQVCEAGSSGLAASRFALVSPDGVSSDRVASHSALASDALTGSLSRPCPSVSD
jgi:hypothetical protein